MKNKMWSGRALFGCVISATILAGATGCSCKPRKPVDVAPVGQGSGDNIGMAGENSPLKDINFAFDSSALDATAKKILKDNADYVAANNVQKFQVEGHCDERGTLEYNTALGNRRARAAYDYLRTLGVAPMKMSTVSYGEELPTDPGHNEVAWAKNRRVHFKIEK
jgi:peptidoglycan-associated lipoprotein